MTNNGSREPITLTITLSPDGQLNVNGPLHNRIICLGMLEMAKAVVVNFKEHSAIAQVRPVVPRLDIG